MHCPSIEVPAPNNTLERDAHYVRAPQCAALGMCCHSLCFYLYALYLVACRFDIGDG
jgi:hypothetical protein